MTTRFSMPYATALSTSGAPLAGAKLYFYASGTSTPQNTYSDAALTVPNTNPVVADAGGRFSDIFLSAATYKVILQTSAGVTVWTADPVKGDVTTTSTTITAADNLLLNGDFLWNQPGASSVSDAAWGFDGWYNLTQTGSVTVAQQTLQENGQPTNIRMTQPDVGAKRIGIAQVIEKRHSQHMRGSAVAFAARIRLSTSQTVRYAILEWTGTADSPTKDVVNDWTNTSYSAGGFFLGSNLVVTAVGSILPASNVWTTLPDITGTISGSCNNLVVMLWSEATMPQNATFDVGLARLNAGATTQTFTFDDPQTTLARCQRFYEGGISVVESPAAGNMSIGVSFHVRKFKQPTVASATVSSLNLSSSGVFAFSDGSGLQAQCAFSASGYRTFSWTADARP